MKDYINLTWKEIEALDRAKTILLLPVGSIEQHGPHLPVDTDSLTAIHIAKGMVERRADFQFVVAPPFRYTYAKPSQVFPGTVSIESETLIKLTRDALRSFIKQGFRKILVMNGHMENTEFLIEGISIALENSNSAKIILCNWWELIDEEEVMEIVGPDWQGWVEEHAALVETSIMLYIAPDLVREEKMVDDRRKNKFEFRIFPWDIANYPATGVFSPARGASREKGEKLIELVLSKVGTLVENEFMR